jgi:hypothetical protein
MAKIPVTDDMRDPKTPKSVIVSTEARAPVTDPTLGVAVPPVDRRLTPQHRLVAIGDSLTHGFQSGAIFNTDVSYPMIIAWELGWDASLRHPRYPGMGGLPLNIEFLVRRLEERFADRIDWWELPLALFEIRQFMAEVEQWWERGPGATPPMEQGINHNLAVYGWDVRDVLTREADIEAQLIGAPKNQLFAQIVENANERAALRVLHSARANGSALTPVQAAQELSADGSLEDGTGEGIETLIVFIGANNALASVVQLKVAWSQDPGYDNLAMKAAYTVWNPVHFKRELDLLVGQVKGIRARHVIWATVPHVTIAPIARGIGAKVRRGSRYFPYYTRPWITDADFDPRDDPCITGAEARAIDSAIDQYNDAIVHAVKQARQQDRKDWYVLDVAGILDRLAQRRYIEDVLARPEWWKPYELPPVLEALTPRPDSCFFRSGPEGRTMGGLFSLDGVHPTTIGYGIVAQEFMNVMHLAGVRFLLGDGSTVRPGPVQVDFRRLIALDTLISHPPRSITTDLRLIGWLDQKLDLLQRLFRRAG